MLRHKYLRGGWKIVILLTQTTIGVFVWWKCGYSLVLWCRLLRTVEQGICTGRLQYFQVTKWLDHLLCRMPYLLGLQTSIPSCTLHYWGWVHCNVTSSTCHHSYHGTVARNEGARFQGSLYWALHVLQSLLRQLSRPQTGKASQAWP